MLIHEDEAENDQVEVATLQVSLLFPCCQNQRLQTTPLYCKRERRKGNEGRKKEARKGTEWSQSWGKEERNEKGEREREKAGEGRGSRKKSYDVWTLASHPAERSNHPPSLRRSSGNVGVPGSAALVLTALPATQAVAPSAEMPKVAHQSPATRARHSLDRARHPPPPRLLPAPPITSLREKADESAEMGKSKRGGEGGNQKNYLYTYIFIYIYNLRKIIYI